MAGISRIKRTHHFPIREIRVIRGHSDFVCGSAALCSLRPQKAKVCPNASLSLVEELNDIAKNKSKG
jgi:hypothetical protein